MTYQNSGVLIYTPRDDQLSQVLRSSHYTQGIGDSVVTERVDRGNGLKPSLLHKMERLR